MSSTLKQISDALVALLESIEELGPGRAAPFAGSVRSFLEEGRTAPFAGVALDSLSYDTLSTDRCLVREELSLKVTLVAQDFRGPGFSLEGGYELLDAVRGALVGASLELEGLAPLEMTSIGKNEQIEEQGITAFELGLKTWRVTGRE